MFWPYSILSLLKYESLEQSSSSLFSVMSTWLARSSSLVKDESPQSWDGILRCEPMDLDDLFFYLYSYLACYFWFISCIWEEFVLYRRNYFFWFACNDVWLFDLSLLNFLLTLFLLAVFDTIFLSFWLAPVYLFIFVSGLTLVI